MLNPFPAAPHADSVEVMDLRLALTHAALSLHGAAVHVPGYILRHLVQRTAHRAAQPEDQADQVVDELLSSLRGLSVGPASWMDFQEIMSRTFDHLDGVANGKIQTISTGLADLDAVFGLRL